MKRLLIILLILIMSSQLINGQVIEPQPEKTPQQNKKELIRQHGYVLVQGL